MARCELVREHPCEVDVSQKLQACGVCSLHEVDEVEPLVRLLEELVTDVRVGHGPQAVRHLRQKGADRVVRSPLEQKFDPRAGLGSLHEGLTRQARREHHHLAQHGHRVSPGVRVVVHVGDAVRHQVVLADGEDLVLDRTLDPGEDAVADHVVELAVALVHVEDRSVAQLDVLQSGARDHGLALGDLTGREVDPHEGAVR